MKDVDDPSKQIARRRVLGAGAALWAGSALALPTRVLAQSECVTRPRQTEGPYFLDTGLERTDIRRDPASGVISAGIPLALEIVVLRGAASRCEPLSGARVDVWHCDANGMYSGVTDGRGDARQGRFLRGYQLTDAAGLVRFQTIYPGWYPGRAVHIHFKVQPRDSAREAFTSQLYFDEALTDQVFRSPLYQRNGERVANREDGLFQRGGQSLLLTVQPSGRSANEGLRAHFTLALS